MTAPDLVVPFRPFPKVPRWAKPIVVTEKIDGTNASVHVFEDGRVWAGSRNRWVTRDADNFGFARWVAENEDDLREGLGVGSHYGEWWGAGIQRGYGMGHRVFSLFNVGRWTYEDADHAPPSCCDVVPVLWEGDALEPASQIVAKCMDALALEGSHAAPGFMNPEGIMIYHTAAGQYFKHPFDPAPKG